MLDAISPAHSPTAIERLLDVLWAATDELTAYCACRGPARNADDRLDDANIAVAIAEMLAALDRLDPVAS